MNSLPIIDYPSLPYLLGMIGGVYFSKRTPVQINSQSLGHIRLGLRHQSLYNTKQQYILGVPGKAFGSNWNSFVFSLSMPAAAWIAMKYFVPLKEW
jgi:SSS family solute:Na+ symporter